MREQIVPSGAAEPGVYLPDALLADVVRSTGASVGLAYVLAPGDRMLHLVLASGAPREITAPWTRIPLDGAIPVGDAVLQGRLIWLSSQEEIARRYPRLGIVLPYEFMLAAAPITSGTVSWGGIILMWPVWHAPQLDPAEQDAISGCCSRAANLLQEATAGGHPLQPVREPRLIPAAHPRKADPTQALAALSFAERLPVGCCSLDLSGKVTYINSAATELVGAGAASLLGKRPWEVLLWLQDPLFEDRYRAAVISRKPTWLMAKADHKELLFQLYPDDSGVSIHITPSTEHTTESAFPTVRPSPTESIGAAALYHLTHLATALAEAVGVRDVVDLAADQIVPAFGPKAMALLTVEEGRLCIATYRGYDAELMARFDADPMTSRTPAVYAITTGEASFYSTFDDLKRAYPPAVHQDGMASWAFLPLIVSGRPVGSLVLAYELHHPFPSAERAILNSLAGLIAQALDRARLYDAKHTLAHTLQTGLLPQTLPRVPGLDSAARYRPASYGLDIGGDFYDMIHCTPTTAIAAIGDVQGHNTTAAALMGQVRTAVHAHATAGVMPGDILARTNHLLADLNRDLFVSCLIAHLDLDSGRAQLATAGHPPALLRHPGGRTDTLHLPPGPLLGVAPDAVYPTVEVTFPPGAVLALYTDGLVERPGADIGDTTTSLASFLSTAQADDLEDLADNLIRAQHTQASHDDTALLLIRRHPGSP